MKLRKRLARNIRRLQGRQSQSVFAKRIGIGQASLNRILNKKPGVSLEMLETICGFLDIEVFELFKSDREEEREDAMETPEIKHEISSEELSGGPAQEREEENRNGQDANHG